MPEHLAQNYKSASQQARVVSEAWGRDNLYCPNCQSPVLRPEPNNKAAFDYSCPNCELPFQLKSQSSPIRSRIADAAYSAMMQAIHEDRTPNLYALHYSRIYWEVRNLILIPHFAFPASAIQKRNPTTPVKRGSSWVGCDIILKNIPLDARISIISEGIPIPPSQVREQFRRLKPLEEISPKERGWTLDVLRVVRSLGRQEFSNSDVYAFESQLESLHPNNRHIRDKIRQQLQVLRDRGFLIQAHRGSWALKEQS
jgi:type II restriction enzyme